MWIHVKVILGVIMLLVGVVLLEQVMLIMQAQHHSKIGDEVVG